MSGRTETSPRPFPERRLRRPIDQLTPRELIQKEIRTERLEIINISQIRTEASIVDEGHAQELGDSMADPDGRGQLIPIGVRALFDEKGKIVYDVYDGFHRTEGKRKTGDKEIDAKVIYACDDEELVDQRILAVNSVQSVQFPRIAQWITDSWALTKFAQRGLGVVQAFQAVVFDTKTSRIVELEEGEMEELKDWVTKKCKKWKRSVSGTWSILRVISNADPELVKQVRSGTGGVKDRVGIITPARLSAVVDVFPGEENYAIQRALMSFITDNRLYAEEARNLLQELREKVKPSWSEQRIQQVANGIILQHQESTRRRVTKGTLHEYAEEEAELSDETMDGATQDNGSTRLFPKEEEKKPHRRHRSSVPQLTHAESIEELRQQVDGLKKEVETLRKKGVDAWWRGADYLSDEERTLMERVMFNNESIHLVSAELRIHAERAVKFMVSAFSKRHVHSKGL